MSLSSLLLRSAKKADKGLDKGLDAIFHSTATHTAPPEPEQTKKKRKHSDDHFKKSKKPKVVQAAEDGHLKKSKNPKIVQAADAQDTDVNGGTEDAHGKSLDKRDKKEKVKKPKLVKDVGAGQSETDSRSQDQAIGSGDSNNDDSTPLVHESLLRKSGTAGSSKGPNKQKYAPPNETAEQREMRTIFVGNVAAEVAKSKPLLKKFKKHILSYTPSAQIESVRFRSIAFQKPVTKLPGDGDEPQPSKSTHKTTDKEPRQHDVDRISSWRDSKGSEAGTVEAEKRYLTPQEKKRIAFIKHDFHEGMDVVNAYVVFAHPQPSESRAPNVPAIPPVLDPYEAAQLAVNNCDGSIFHERTIRVDDIHENDKSRSSGGGDPKLSVFVGNLDFASKEEDLRVFFEGIVTVERGPAPQRQDESESDDVADKKVAKSPRWVTRVRIIRDKDTQLGKGFAYIQFADRECVDEVLALEQDKLKFAKRKLRVQRCRSLTGGASLNLAKRPSTLQHDAPPSKRTSIDSIPKGDPSLGKRLEHLSKEERKKRKALDADRIARRLAKKRVKAAVEKAGGNHPSRDTERTRKRPDPKKVVAISKPKKLRSTTSQRNRNR